jgi:hypothetical protein
MKFLLFFPYLWVIFALLDPDLDSGSGSTDLIESGFGSETLVWDAEEVYSEVETCCRALSERLDNSAYFFGSKPTELGKSPFLLTLR